MACETIKRSTTATMLFNVAIGACRHLLLCSVIMQDAQNLSTLKLFSPLGIDSGISRILYGGGGGGVLDSLRAKIFTTTPTLINHASSIKEIIETTCTGLETR